MRKLLLMAGVVSAFVQAFGASATSATSVVWTKPDESLQWKTVMSTSTPVALCWPDGADSAQLTIEADGVVVVQTNITDTTAREVLVIPPTFPAEYSAERVLVFSIEYRDGDSELLAPPSVVRLGWVTGVNGNGTRLIPTASGNAWKRVEKYAVLPIPEDTTALTVDSAAQEYDAPGWWEWRRIASGDHALALIAGGEEFLATLTGHGGGFVLIVR